MQRQQHMVMMLLLSLNLMLSCHLHPTWQQQQRLSYPHLQG
jgi:hypothetical protein